MSRIHPLHRPVDSAEAPDAPNSSLTPFSRFFSAPPRLRVKDSRFRLRWFLTALTFLAAAQTPAQTSPKSRIHPLRRPGERAAPHGPTSPLSRSFSAPPPPRVKDSRFHSRCLLAGLAFLAASHSPAQTSPKIGEWQSLFDGKTLQAWRESLFPGRGPVRIENGHIVLGPGAPMAGITWTGTYPHANYEIRFEAARLEGGDFFASLTFPVDDSFCTWVTGGWGGDIVGLSSIDGWDASDNETRSYFDFEKGRWYTLRLQVAGRRIRAWIDDRAIIDVNVAGRRISLRPGDTKFSAPLGLASYNTTGAVRKIEYRLLRAVPE